MEPNLRPLIAATYEATARLHIVPLLGAKRLDRLTVQDMCCWLNKLANTCQSCAQGKGARRPEERQRCCVKGKCCRQTPSKRSVNDARTILRSALTNAMVEEDISKNVAQLVKVQRAPRKRPDLWSVEEACTFLENAQIWRDNLYGAYVLTAGPPAPAPHRHRQDRSLASRAPAPGHLLDRFPPPANAAASREGAGQGSLDRIRPGLHHPLRHPGRAEDFNRGFNRRSDRADVRHIRVHDTRHTCASLLAALDVHPRIAIQILRHSEIAVTMAVYTHVPSAETRRALRNLGRALGGGSKQKKEGEGQAARGGGRAVRQGRPARVIAVAVFRCCTHDRGPFTITWMGL
ncbi:hypothetical protein JCM4814A_00620 [Streptomyces phaeofaciens JCM 4814]|uniref:Tyr recombinase domain-containing protein n=1 Tax=Streptomyces phaeofaciens TaxID=68254 RepID=A0A918M1D8_9ACTN|nr:hypothetical protein GCM10010226_92020 [Streptomyces phaeofaciens]